MSINYSVAQKSLHPIPSLAVANFFVEQSIQTGIELTPMKLIKIVYIAHGWSLAMRKAPLIDEGVEAWKYGPVVRSVYDKFKHYRDSQITQMAQISDGVNLFSPQVHDMEIRNFLQSVWSTYSKFSGWQLSFITHEDGTPWSETWEKNGGGDRSGAVIPNDLLAEYYEKLLKERKT
jgi:uncharacterized phage-associated protein